MRVILSGTAFVVAGAAFVVSDYVAGAKARGMTITGAVGAAMICCGASVWLAAFAV